jgi:sulfur carrier protein
VAILLEFIGVLKVLTLCVNGAPLSFAEGSTVAALLENLAMSGKRLAVERNGEIVPRSQYDAVVLKPDDRLEIVVAVGGG